MSDEADSKKSGGFWDNLPIDKAYDDALHPAMVQVGKVGEILGRVVNAALSPLRYQVWQVEQYYAFLEGDVAAKLADVPPENIIPPSPRIAFPLLQDVQLVGDDQPDLREMYANLLAKAMNSNEVENVNPAYVKILSELTAFDVRLLSILDEKYEAVNGTYLLQLHPPHQPIKSFLMAYSYQENVPDDPNPNEIPILLSPSAKDYRVIIANLERLGLVASTELVTPSTEDDRPYIEDSRIFLDRASGYSPVMLCSGRKKADQEDATQRLTKKLPCHPL